MHHIMMALLGAALGSFGGIERQVQRLTMGQVMHGQFAGLSLIYVPAGGAVCGNPNPTGLTLTAGNAYIDGVVHSWNGVTVCGANNNLLGPNVNAFAAKTTYYCYVVADLPAGQPLMCSTITPTGDGHPSQALTLPGAIMSTHGLFVGSILTTPAQAGVASVRPFYRNGDEVLLSNPEPTTIDIVDEDLDIDSVAGSPNTFTFTHATQASWVQRFISAAPVTAWSSIVEVTVVNLDAAPHVVYCLNGQSTFSLVGGLLKNIEVAEAIEVSPALLGPPAIPGIESDRLRSISGNYLYCGLGTTLPVGATLSVEVSLRGYHETIR